VRPNWWWAVPIVGLLGLTALYLEPLRVGFLNDDYLFLEQAQARPLAETMREPGVLSNYYRPISRQIYFEALTPLAHGQPAVFHAVNFALFLLALILLWDLLTAFLPAGAALVGLAYFAVLPFQRVNLIWISCSQDLLALVFTLAAFASFRRGRDFLAALLYAAAVFSKESAVPLPLALAAWSLLQDRARTGATVRRLVPCLVVALVWAAIAWTMRSTHPNTAAFLHFDPVSFVAGYVHGVQSLIGLEAPPRQFEALWETAPAWLPLAAAIVIALLRASPGPPSPGAGRQRLVVRFAVAWLLAFGFVTGPVAATWSGYYYTLFAVGGALLVGLWLGPLGRVSFAALLAGLLWWHAAAVESRSFAIADNAWGMTSHLTSGYFQRAATLTDTLSRGLLRREPKPPAGARFFFATLPPWSGFQMGNGALLRTLYRDPSLESYFYSQFSDTTAGERPCLFFYWDGAEMQRLYGESREPFFQVGTDLLLLNRPTGAVHAFRRGLEAGESQFDHLYWLGWAQLWSGHRELAEAAWLAFGARDDSTLREHDLRAAHDALVARDTLTARRALLQAIRHGVGYPESHAVLGQLLVAPQPKYGMLELQVASALGPTDWPSRRDLAIGLVTARLDESAERVLRELEPLDPMWDSDSGLVQARRTLAGRSHAGLTTIRF